MLTPIRYADAERDCSNALERQQDSIKALYRRALARRGLDDLVGAESGKALHKLPLLGIVS